MPVSIRSTIRLFPIFHIIGAPARLFLSLLLVVALSGCSAVKLGYNNAPSLSYWWLDSYLDFDDAQSLKVRADLGTLQDWHRANELPLYVALLEKLQRMAPASTTPEQVCNLAVELRGRVQVVLDQAEPAVAALAPTFKAEQLEHLAKQYDKRNQKWRAEWLGESPGERIARRIRQLVERTEMLYGRLEEPQLAALRASETVTAFDASLSYREAVRRQQDTLQTLRQLQNGAPGDARTRTAVHAWFTRALNSPDAAYRNYLAKMTQESCKAFATLHNGATPAQRARLLETLKDYETDARTLITAKP